MSKKQVNRWVIIAVAVLVVIQFIPVDRSNPPVNYEPEWDSAKTKELFVRACMDCHSNETEWPWYSYVAPFSFMIDYDIKKGREYFNISEPVLDHANDAGREVKRGDMPVRLYSLFHPKARLTDQEKEDFIKGLEATFGTSTNPHKYENVYSNPEEN